MNKSDIIKAAEEAAECNFTSSELKPSYARACAALIAAAEFLKQVEALPEGSEPMVGDLVSYKAHDSRIYYAVIFDESDLAYKKAMQPIVIIQRAGKPVITRGSV